MSGDIRPLSFDPRFAGIAFEGKLSDAIKQARQAPDFALDEQGDPISDRPVGMSRDRFRLLQHLNIAGQPKVHDAATPGFWSLANAISRGWLR